MTTKNICFTRANKSLCGPLFKSKIEIIDFKIHILGLSGIGLSMYHILKTTSIECSRLDCGSVTHIGTLNTIYTHIHTNKHTFLLI